MKAVQPLRIRSAVWSVVAFFICALVVAALALIETTRKAALNEYEGTSHFPQTVSKHQD